MKNDAVEKLIDHLTKLGLNQRKPRDVDMGICYELNRMNDRGIIDWPLCRKVLEMIWAWPEGQEGSGHVSPVPHPNFTDARLAYWRTKIKWGDDAYGDARRRLCLWLAEELKQGLEK